MSTKSSSMSPPKSAKNKDQAPKKKLCYYKCNQCRQDRQKCDEIPENRVWPGQKCPRCKKYGYACSENVDSEGNPMPLGRSQYFPAPYSRSQSSNPVPQELVRQRVEDEPTLAYPDSEYNYLMNYPQGSFPLAPYTTSDIYNIQPEPIYPLPALEAGSSRSTVDIPTIHFTWLHSCNFRGYVTGQISDEGKDAIRRVYGMVSTRRRAIMAYETKVAFESSSTYPLPNDYDLFQQQRVSQKFTNQYNTSYEPGSNQVDIYTPSHLDRTFTSRSSYNASSSQTSLSTANNQQPIIPTPNLTETERTGLRWKELIEELRSEDILLIDPFYSASFEELINHGSDDEFYHAKLNLCAASSYARELCLRLSGIVNMIEELKTTRRTMSVETRGYIAYNIDSRVEKVVPLSLSSLDIKDSPHSSLGQYEGSDYEASLNPHYYS